MERRLPPSELDDLVRDINRLEGEAEPAAAAGADLDGLELRAPAGEAPALLDAPAQPVVSGDEPLERLLAPMVARGASDLLLIAGLPPVLRVHGRLERLSAPVLDADTIRGLFAAHLGGRLREELERDGAADFSLRVPPAAGRRGAWRLRVNLHLQRGQLAAALRALPQEIPTLASLNLPPALAELVKPHRGLILVCGPTGSGKSSTLAALVGEINRTRSCHVITIEDPVEYEHPHGRAIVEHIEVGRDAPSFAAALRGCLRQDPDVVLVGEMRDLETIATALTAAETGHLILSTLHTNDVSQAVHRIVDVFPPPQQPQIRQQLALSLHAIAAQQLVPRADGSGRVPAIELLIASYPVRHHIRNDTVEKMYNEISMGARAGMISLEASLADLVGRGVITLEEARVRSQRPELLESLLR